MPWSGLIHSAPGIKGGARATYKNLVLRIEDTDQPGWLVRVYEGDRLVGEVTAEGPQQAVVRAVELVRGYLHDDNLSPSQLDWVQM